MFFGFLINNNISNASGNTASARIISARTPCQKGRVTNLLPVKATIYKERLVGLHGLPVRRNVTSFSQNWRESVLYVARRHNYHKIMKTFFCQIMVLKHFYQIENCLTKKMNGHKWVFCSEMNKLRLILFPNRTGSGAIQSLRANTVWYAPQGDQSNS